VNKALPLKRNRSESLWQQAVKIIPAGTQTFSKGPGQYVNGVAPKYIQRAQGGHVWDVDGNEFIDYGMALGPIILGYAHPRVSQAIIEQLQDGITYTLMHPREVELSELLVELIPCAEMVRFGKNGSDATAGTVRLARAYTRRDKIACCGYHGWQDWYIGSTSRNLGVPKAVRELTLQFQYNNIDSLKTIFDQNPDEVAAVILEPVNFYEPRDGFLEAVKELTHRHGALLIFDEIITGFRMALGGAQEYFGVVPDLAAFGKAMGNGMPISAIVGKAEIMRLFEEAFFSFTFGGEVLSLAASLATIRELQERNALSHIWNIGQSLRDGYNDIVAEIGLQDITQCIGYPCWPELIFTGPDGRPWSHAQSLFQQEIVKRGILTRPGMFVCYAHSVEDLRTTLTVFCEALEVLREAVQVGSIVDQLEGEVIEPVIRSTMQVAPR
jgi:glutamate-1-semialdehyde-2,1-aminomutase